MLRNKQLPPHVACIAQNPPTRPAPRCISPGPLDRYRRPFARASLLLPSHFLPTITDDLCRLLDVHLANEDDVAEAARLQETALHSAALDVYTLPAVLKCLPPAAFILKHSPLTLIYRHIKPEQGRVVNVSRQAGI
jgi:hypothetical protein